VPRHTVTIPQCFNGPLDSGQGGYSAGVLAPFLDGQAEVSLRRPVPLDRPLDVVRDGDGALRLLDGDELVADAQTVARVDVDVPDPVGVEEAREATTHYLGSREGQFSRCFVCGLARDDALGVFAGEVPGRRVMASPWTPPAWAAGDDGSVRPEFVWAALDCPATFATVLGGTQGVGLLARFSARIDAPVAAAAEHVVIGWPIAIDGRKYHAGSAIFSRDGALLAAARALLIAPRDPSR
jgi:hypothetical protein